MRIPIPARPGRPDLLDYEYRAGTTHIFMFTEPLSGWREARVSTTKMKPDLPAKQPLGRATAMKNSVESNGNSQRQMRESDSIAFIHKYWLDEPLDHFSISHGIPVLIEFEQEFRKRRILA